MIIYLVNTMWTFLLGCIGTRLSLAVLAAMLNRKWLRRMGYLTVLPAIGFAVIYLFGLRKTGFETGGQPIWWNHLRPFHSIAYGLFSAGAIHGSGWSWLILLVDALVGLVAWLGQQF